MGVCSSCLGLKRRTASEDLSDTSRLLGDSYQNNYGGTVTSANTLPDPEEVRRQRDALERLCAQTSDNLIDISHYIKPTAQVEAESPAGLHKTPDFQRLFTERFSKVDPLAFPPSWRSMSQTSIHEQAEGNTGESEARTGNEEDWLMGLFESNPNMGTKGPVFLWMNIYQVPKGSFTFKIMTGSGELQGGTGLVGD